MLNFPLGEFHLNLLKNAHVSLRPLKCNPERKYTAYKHLENRGYISYDNFFFNTLRHSGLYCFFLPCRKNYHALSSCCSHQQFLHTIDNIKDTTYGN